MVNPVLDSEGKSLSPLASAISHEQKLRKQLDRLALIFMARSIQNNLDDSAKTFVVSDITFVESYRRLVDRFLSVLVDENYLQLVGGRYLFVKDIPMDTEIDQIAQFCLTIFPSNVKELQVVKRCGLSMPQVLRGEIPFVSVLFEDGDISAVEVFYRNSTISRLYNKSVASLMRDIVEDGAKILEVGAGSGGTTEFILPEISAIQCDYTFTDISKAFLIRAKRKFKEYQLDYGIFDINTQTTEASIKQNKYDVLVCCNVLHVANNISTTLRYLKDFMNPGAKLVLLEMVKPDRWVDIVFGPTDGWWGFEDFMERKNYPLMADSQWLDVLEKCGYVDSQCQSPLAHHDVHNLSIISAHTPTY